MKTPLQIRVYRQQELGHTAMLSDQLQFGRQKPGEPAPIHYEPSAGRLVVSPLDDKLVSREHLLIRLIPDSSPIQIEVRNLSKKRSVTIEDCGTAANCGKLGPEQSTQVNAPLLVSFEDIAIRVEAAGSTFLELQSLRHPTLAPSILPVENKASIAIQKTLIQATAKQSYTVEQLMHWLGETMEVLQSAAGASDFLTQAVSAVDRIVGLDTIAALRYEEGQWSIKATQSSGGSDANSNERAPSQTVLRELLERKSTVFHVPADGMAAASLLDIRALVAAPILDASENVIGAIYGARYSRHGMQLPQISELEAAMVEVIACSAAAGIAREKHQQQALKARIQFEQFFTPELARELESNPQLLDGQDADISVLFCDVVGFSATSQQIGSQLTMQWISDVMDFLSDAILEHDGVVVDYLGDELMAMWGAPKPQADHATKACLAAAELMRCKAAIDSIWKKTIGRAIEFRIGICSGMASVGNTGSKRRLKYGPLGSTVNLASRLQNAAKQMGAWQLISASTAHQMQATDSLKLRSLGTAAFVNIPTPIEVFEIMDGSGPQIQTQIDRFSQVITALQENDVEQARDRLDKLVLQFPNDTPARRLLDRLAMNQVDPKCIWRFDTK